MPASNGVSLKRKIQRLGASSLIVTLPKEWAKRNKVNVGDMLRIYDDGDKLIIAPDGYTLQVSLEFNLSHFNVEKHALRLALCSYVFGFDKVVFTSDKPVKGMVADGIKRLEDILGSPDVKVTREDARRIIVDLGEKGFDTIDSMIDYGRRISRLLNKLSSFLEERFQLTREDIDMEYKELLRVNYQLLRAANSAKSTDTLEEKRAKYMASAASLIGLISDTVYKFSLDLLYMAKHLEQSEKQRLAFLLQILEVALSTVVLSCDPPSVKKAEESYWKLRSILDLEGNLGEIIESGTPAFAYLLAKLLDIARVMDITENVILCHALVLKFNESEAEKAQ